MFKKLGILIMVLMLVLLAASCNSNGVGNENGSTSDETYDLAIATGGSGGLFNLVGTAMADVINRSDLGIKASAQGTAASVENLRLVGTGAIPLGLCGSDAAYNGFNGLREFQQAYPDVRVALSTYQMALHILTRSDSGIKSLSDLKGKKIAVGAPGGLPDGVARVILDGAMGFKRDQDYEPFFISVAETIDALKDRTVDAGFICLGVPTSSIIDLTESVNTTFIPVDNDLLDELVQENPYFTKFPIKVGAYKGITEDIPTLGIPTLIIINKDVPEDVAYKVTKTLIEKRDEIAAVHPTGNEFTLDNSTRGVAIPFHPGSQKYLEENGVVIQK